MLSVWSYRDVNWKFNFWKSITFDCPNLGSLTAEPKIPPKLTEPSHHNNWSTTGITGIAAFCHHRNELRVFAIDNISSSKILDQQTVETIDLKQLEQFLISSYGIFSGTAQHIPVLESSKFRAKRVADESRHPNQQGQWLDNGNYQLGIPFNDSHELIMGILKHGAEVEVKTSEFLREAVIQQIAAMQKKYKQ